MMISGENITHYCHGDVHWSVYLDKMRDEGMKTMAVPELWF